MNVYNKYRFPLQPLPDVPTLALDSCQLAVGIRKESILLSGSVRNADNFKLFPGTANAKQLSNYRGSMPDTSDTTKVTARRGKGMQCMGAGHGINKCAGLPPALPLFVVTTERGKGVSEVARSLLAGSSSIGSSEQVNLWT